VTAGCCYCQGCRVAFERHGMFRGRPRLRSTKPLADTGPSRPSSVESGSIIVGCAPLIRVISARRCHSRLLPREKSSQPASGSRPRRRSYCSFVWTRARPTSRTGKSRSRTEGPIRRAPVSISPGGSSPGARRAPRGNALAAARPSTDNFGRSATRIIRTHTGHESKKPQLTSGAFCKLLILLQIWLRG
jgi:hypothetical protein